MKPILLATVLLSLVTLVPQALAQQDEQTRPQLVVKPSINFGGFGGPVFKINQLGDGILFGMGGRGGMTVASIFTIGGAGYGTLGQSSVSLNGTSQTVSLGYGGLGLGFKIFPSFFIHVSNFTTLGMGRIALSESGESSTCFVIEPELNAEFTLASFLRAGLGVTYRFLFAKGITPSWKELSGLGGQIYIEFGWL